MIRWNNDYNHGAIPEILDALQKTNDDAFAGYGMDEINAAAADIIKNLCEEDVDVHFLVGGTQTNMVLIDAALRPYQSPICADSGHINVHETGAVEATRHKIIAVKGTDGKLNAEQVRKLASDFADSGIKEHVTMPKLVYISHPTEFGTLYTKKEVQELRAVCDEYGLYLFLDGARLAYAFGAEGNDLTMADLAQLTDAFYIGGTKCGALFGEALVISNNELKPDFRSYIKMNGGMLAKGWLLGVQFYTLLKDGLYFEIGRKADEQAARIKNTFNSNGVPCYIDNNTNQVFLILNNRQLEAAGKEHIYEFQERLDEDRCVVRFCTSWSTKDEDVEKLLLDIPEISK